MLAALRSRAPASFSPSDGLLLRLVRPASTSLSAAAGAKRPALLELAEVEKVLNDVRADDVKVIPVGDQCGWTDHMVVASGRSAWHVRNIAQALIHKVKQKQKGSERILLPSVEGHGGGKWIIIDSGNVIVHALDENARAYYNLESLWAKEKSPKDPVPDLEEALVKTRRRNNSKKPMKSTE